MLIASKQTQIKNGQGSFYLPLCSLLNLYVYTHTHTHTHTHAVYMLAGQHSPRSPAQGACIRWSFTDLYPLKGSVFALFLIFFFNRAALPLHKVFLFSTGRLCPFPPTALLSKPHWIEVIIFPPN